MEIERENARDRSPGDRSFADDVSLVRARRARRRAYAMPPPSHPFVSIAKIVRDVVVVVVVVLCGVMVAYE